MPKMNEIKYVRELFNYTQGEFAKLVGISRMTLIQVEKGENVSQLTKSKLAKTIISLLNSNYSTMDNLNISSLINAYRTLGYNYNDFSSDELSANCDIKDDLKITLSYIRISLGLSHEKFAKLLNINLEEFLCIENSTEISTTTLHKLYFLLNSLINFKCLKLTPSQVSTTIEIIKQISKKIYDIQFQSIKEIYFY